MRARRDRRAREGAVLVIGFGFIGRHVVRALRARGREVVVVTRSRSPLGVALSTRVLVGNAASQPLLREALSGVSSIVYCAGGLMPAQSNLLPADDPALALPPLLVLLEELRDRPDVDLTFLSSGGMVYGPTQAQPITEDAPLRPLTSYGVLKMAAEAYIDLYATLYGVRSRVLRCANVYGEGQPADRGQGAVAVFLDRISRGVPIVLYGDGSVVRDYVWVGDVAGVIADLVGRWDGHRILNVGSGIGTSLTELIALAERSTGMTALVEGRPKRDFDASRVVLDVTRLRRLVPFDPLSIADGVELVWRTEQEEPDDAEADEAAG